MSDEKLLTYADFTAKFREYNVEYLGTMITEDTDGLDHAKYIADNKIIIPILFIRNTHLLDEFGNDTIITCNVQNIDENDPKINHRLATGANIHITVTNPNSNVKRVRFMLCDQDGNGLHNNNGEFMYTGIFAINSDASILDKLDDAEKVYTDHTRKSEEVCGVDCETNTLYYYGKDLEYTLAYNPYQSGIWGNPFSVKASESDDLITYKAYFEPKRNFTSLNSLDVTNIVDFANWDDYNHDQTTLKLYPIMLNNINTPNGTSLNSKICYLFPLNDYPDPSKTYCSEVFNIMTITGNRPGAIQGVVANGVWMNLQTSLAYKNFNLTHPGPLVGEGGEYYDAKTYLLFLLTSDSDKEYFLRESIHFTLKIAQLSSDYVIAYDCLEPIIATSK